MLRAAADVGRPVTLLSAADAGIHAGAGWFAALVDAAGAAVPAARFTAILDCADDPGAAMAAIRAGIAAIVFTGRDDVAERLVAIAAARGARLLAERPSATLDLGAAFFADAGALHRQCAEALAGAATNQPSR